MKLSRRNLLKASLGATQLGLLSNLGARPARAQSATGPTKLLSIWIPGGLNHEQIWCPLSPAGIAKFISSPAGADEPYFYNAQMVQNYDGTTGPGGAYPKIRGPIWWNPAIPSDRHSPNPASGGTQTYVPWGYSWVSRDLSPAAVFEKAVMVHGIDQGTAAHESGKVASMCGVAGGDFRAPAIAAVVANAMLARFPDRPVPSVSIGGVLNPKAVATSANPMPSSVSPTYLTTLDGLVHSLSDYPTPAWGGLRARTSIADVGFDGTPLGGQLPATVVDQAALAATRAQRGRANAATDALLQELYDTYRGVSRAIARDVVKIVQNTPGVEHLPAAIPWATDTRRFGYIIGLADGGGTADWDADFDLVLKLLKSDVVTSITLPVHGAKTYSYDTHSPPAALPHVNNLRGTFEVIGRLLIEMMLTPSPSQPGQTLLDETLVHIWSDFGRTFLRPNTGSDHHPATTMILVGGGAQGNRMIGGYDETMSGSPLGVPVELIDIESGGTSRHTAVPRASDAAATVCRAFGLQAGRDFFIPGGYSEIAGVLTP
jgi:hypothetical protein